MTSLLSIVAPAYNEAACIVAFHDRLTEVCRGINGFDYEILIINDGSSDQTEELLHQLCRQDPHMAMVSLSRNYGHEIAVAAGMDYARGDAIVLMDADLQDPPELIPQMIAKYQEGYDVVNARRSSRAGETWMKKWTAKEFYKVFARSSGRVHMEENVGNFRLVSRRARDAFCRLRESHRFARGLFSWVGFPTAEVVFERDARLAGKTKYNYRSMISLAVEGLTSFTTAPLHWATYTGLAAVAFAVIYTIYVLVMFFTHDPHLQPGWSSMVIIILIFGSCELLSLGIIGEYLGRIFDESKHRPLYFIKEYTVHMERRDSAR